MQHTGTKIGTISRVVKYVLKRGLVLALMVVVGVYLAIVVINYGGNVDSIFRANIDEALIGVSVSLGQVTPEVRAQALAEARSAMEEAYGLNDPFFVRCMRWLYHGLTFDWGRAERLRMLFSTSNEVRNIILERLPNTLLLFGVSNFLVFFVSLNFALWLSRRRANWADRLVVILSPLSSVPSWIYGMGLTIILAARLHILPFGNALPAGPFSLGYAPATLKQMVMPMMAFFLSAFFQSIYAWRTFFLLSSTEDYVDLAIAKGLSNRQVEKSYILRPALPYVVTSFSLMLITMWQGSPPLEQFFSWPGIGSLMLSGIRLNDRPVIVALIVVFAYLLALTVFLLDIVYAFLDPRVSVSSESPAGARMNLRGWRFAWKRGKGGIKKTASSRDPTSVSLKIGLIKLASRIRTEARESSERMGNILRELLHYPSAAAGMAFILILIGLSVYTVIAIPYSEAVFRWKTIGEQNYRSPVNARPIWFNYLQKDKLPPTIIMNSRDPNVARETREIADGITETSFSFVFDFPYDDFPKDMALVFETFYREKRPFITLTWISPDGREIPVSDFSIVSGYTYYMRGDTRLQKRLDSQKPLEAVFADPSETTPVPLKGTHELRISGLFFEDGTTLEAELILYGQVHGWAGTDHRRRDLMTGLLWGIPVALVFGFIGAVGTSLFTMLIAALGAWFGGWVDGLIQRITEMNMMLPSLAIALGVYYMYVNSVWIILGVMVLFNIFGSSIKTYRSAFKQIKESAYIDAARVYGATNWRIVRHYLLPRMLPMMVPHMVITFPGYVFLEVTLAYLGVSDLFLPTWGKIIHDSLTNGVFENFYYYWAAQPLALVLATGLAFAMMGSALERILNPRL